MCSSNTHTNQIQACPPGKTNRIVRNKANDRSKSTSPHAPDGSPSCIGGDASNPSSEGGHRSVSGGNTAGGPGTGGGFNISSIMSPTGNNNNTTTNNNNNNNNSSSNKRKGDVDTVPTQLLLLLLSPWNVILVPSTGYIMRESYI
ncbi:hypothetical protein ElyMa_003419400 [Elysia marginata]|uniref:Uncharacterized protein n=1 Tax=Elysia marginata TaxID=1093978 RepID=A0AAV4JS60_9GAST|nr:hypothetical protein ElyMa_003419400 [Elysia marginata]